MNTKQLAKVTVVAAALLAPAFAFANTLKDLFCTIGGLVLLITPMVVALALLGFFWGLAMYIFSLGGAGGTAAHSMYGAPASPEGKQTGRTVMLYGIITLFVMVSVWGLVNILQTTFGIGGGSITPPSLTDHSVAPPGNLRCNQ